MYYVVFFMLMVTNFYLWQSLQGGRKSAKKTERNKLYMKISVAFALSYLYRSVSDTIQVVNHEAWEGFQDNWPYLWSIYLFGLHGIGELLPLAFLFRLQMKRNRKPKDEFEITRRKRLSDNLNVFFSYSGYYGTSDNSSPFENRKSKNQNNDNPIEQ